LVQEALEGDVKTRQKIEEIIDKKLDEGSVSKDLVNKVQSLADVFDTANAKAVGELAVNQEEEEDLQVVGDLLAKAGIEPSLVQEALEGDVKTRQKIEEIIDKKLDEGSVSKDLVNKIKKFGTAMADAHSKEEFNVFDTTFGTAMSFDAGMKIGDFVRSLNACNLTDADVDGIGTHRTHGAGVKCDHIIGCSWNTADKQCQIETNRMIMPLTDDEQIEKKKYEEEMEELMGMSDDEQKIHMAGKGGKGTLNAGMGDMMEKYSFR